MYYTLDKTYDESWHWLLNSHNLTKLLCCVDSQPWENIKLLLTFLMILTYGWDLKVVICSLWIGSLLIKAGDNSYSQDRHHDISKVWDNVNP